MIDHDSDLRDRLVAMESRLETAAPSGDSIAFRQAVREPNRLTRVRPSSAMLTLAGSPMKAQPEEDHP